MIIVDNLSTRPVEVRLVEAADVPADLPQVIWIDALDQILDRGSGATIVDGTITVELVAGAAALELVAGTSCRYRIRGLPTGDRTVTLPAGADPISLDELPEAAV